MTEAETLLARWPVRLSRDLLQRGSALYLNFDQSKNPSALLSAAINADYFPYALGGNNEYESFTGHTIIPFGKNNYQAAVYSYSNLAVPPIQL